MRVKLRRAKMAGEGEAREGLQVAEYEKLVLEVDAEMLYLNTVGLRKLGVWLGIRSARLEGKGRVTVLGDVRVYIHRSIDAEDTLEGKVAFLREMRDHIRQLMEDPDNWEQTPSRDRAMVVSPFSTRPRDSSVSTQPPPLLREGTTRPRPQPRPQPRPPPGDDLMDTPARPVRSLPSLPTERPKKPVLAGTSRKDEMHPTELPTFSVNSIPPWNRGGQVALDELSLDQSVRQRVADDRRRQAERHTVSLESESDIDTVALLPGDDDVQRTYTVTLSEEEDNARIEMLQREIVELKLKRKRADLSSSKSSSSGSSTHRVPQPKLSKRSARSSLQRVPQSSKVSDLAGSVRRKVGVSGPGHSSNQSSDDSLSEDDKLKKEHKKSSAGVKPPRRKYVTSSDDDRLKVRRHPKTKPDKDMSKSRRTHRKLAVSSDEEKLKVKRRSHRKLAVPSDEKLKVKGRSRRKSDDESLSDKDRSKSKRRERKRSVLESSDDARLKCRSKKKASSSSSSSVTSSSDETVKSKKSSRKSTGKSKKGGRKGCTVGELKDAWRREFKIKGQIGKIGDKENKLDYLSVKRQISAGIEKGYKDAELIEGIINCTTPGTTIRSFLQSSEGLTIPIVLDILRSYFQEADTVELLQRLATAVQGPKEDAQTFLMACLDLKNRIVRSEDDDIGFSRETVMKILLKTLESGLSDDRILNSMRPFLSNPAVSDEVLIREMSHAVMLEKKRKERSKAPRVASVEVEEPSSDAAEIAKLQKQLDKLREEKASDSNNSAQLAQLQASLNKLVHGKHRQYGCKACKSAGKGKTCSHCFICGKDDHKVVDCPKRNNKEEGKKEDKDESLNSNRSPTRDS